MAALMEVKRINLTDLKQFLSEDHNSFSVLNAVLNQIKSTNKISVTTSKNSANLFSLAKPMPSMPKQHLIILKPKNLTTVQLMLKIVNFLNALTVREVINLLKKIILTS